MKTCPIIYIAHPETGEFIGTGYPDQDPLDQENWLIPAHAYIEAPPIAGENQKAMHGEDRWHLVPDYRGSIYYTADGNRHEITDLGERLPVGALDQPPPPSAAELAIKAREEWKASRAAAVEAIDVTTAAGNTFDGDEISQGRMARAILALNAAAPGTTVNWILADNSVIDATAAELTEALALAGAAQAALWVAP